MKKIITLLILVFIIFNSCERDDICIDEITPHLIIRFYDFENQTETKNADLISVKLMEIENDSIILSSSDSIVLPIVNTNNITEYILTISNDDGTINRDTLVASYDVEDVFVGRSCGFKSIFKNPTYELVDDSDKWIEGIEKVKDTIENETAAHVKIFH